MKFLKKIIKVKKEEIALAKHRATLAVLKKRISTIATPRPLIKQSCLMLIAEIKKKSPSRDVIRKNMNFLELACMFEKKGSAAISVLTDHTFFGGSLDMIPKIKQIVHIPILRKDFIIDPYQVYESRAHGADIILLIARILKKKLPSFVQLALKLGLQPLIEVHTNKEIMYIKNAIKNNQGIIIGINNRDLDSFTIDMQTSLKLINKIPSSFIRIAESGIQNRRQLTTIKNAGFDGVLIGEGLAKNKTLINYFKK